MPADLWEKALNYGAVGGIAFMSCGALVFIFRQQIKDLKEHKDDIKALNAKIVGLLETTVQHCTDALNKVASSNDENTRMTKECTEAIAESSAAKVRFAEALERLPCNSEKWRKRLNEGM